MKQQVNRYLPYILLVTLLTFIAGCGSSSVRQVSGLQGSNLPPPETLTVSANRTLLFIGQQATFSTRLNHGPGQSQDVTDQVSWSSSATSVAAAPRANGVVTALEPGQTTISASLRGLSSAGLTITVTDTAEPSVISLRIENGDAIRSPGSTIAYRALATMSDGSEIDVTSQVAWSSDQTRITIDSNGLATISDAVPAGTQSTIRASFQKQHDTVALTVNQFLFTSNFDDNTVSSWKVDPSNGILEPTRHDTPTGLGPSILALSPNSRFLYVTNQQSDQLSAFQIATADGTLIPLEGTPIQTGEFPYGAATDPRGRFLAVANKQSHTVQIFSLSASTGKPESLSTLSGTNGLGQGPLIVAFHPALNVMYVTNVDDATISLFSYTDAGEFSSLASPVNTGQDPGELKIHPSGNFLYVSNFSDNTISAYRIDTDGSLSELATYTLTGVGTPLFQSFHPTGSWLYVGNPGDSTVVVFKVAPDGQLLLNSVQFGLGTTRGIAFSHKGVLYTASQDWDRVYASTIDPVTGMLRNLPNSPYPTAQRPFDLTITP